MNCVLDSIIKKYSVFLYIIYSLKLNLFVIINKSEFFQKIIFTYILILL